MGILIVGACTERRQPHLPDVSLATGTSQRHVNALAENVRLAAKAAEHPPLGVEGDSGSDWVLVDLGDVIAHVMTAEKREFYDLEKLWSVGPSTDDGEQPPANPSRRLQSV